MSDRSRFLFSVVASGATDSIDLPVIPVGKTLVIQKLRFSEPNSGDNKSSVFLVQWGAPAPVGFTEVGGACVTGTMVEEVIDEEFVGDGVKFIRIMRQNNSNANKRLMFRMYAHDK